MDYRVTTGLHSGAKDLARAEPFELGPLRIDPPARRIATGARSEMVEPRVMRVLVALGETPGRVLSRDELIELCWDGQIVSDSAITRVVSMLRHTLAGLAGDVVTIETITKVGFRLIVDGDSEVAGKPGESNSIPRRDARRAGDNAVPPYRLPWTRRALAGGIAATAAGGALAYTFWFRRAKHVPDPRAVELYRHGQMIQRDGVFEQMGEALTAYKQAVSIDPRYADAWGALALSYRYPVIGPGMRLGDPQEVRTAAQRALALDPGNADAKLALLCLNPYTRRWQEREVQLRAFLRDHPDSALGHFALGGILVDVGRIEDAVALNEHVIAIDPTRQICWAALALTYYLAGRDREGDVIIEGARSRWPQDRMLYVLGYYDILFSKRYKEALAYVSDTGRRPRVFRREQVEYWMREADALATGRGFAEQENMLRTEPVSVAMETIALAAPSLALYGKVDEMFALLEVYFFGGIVNGTRIAPPGPLDLRTSGPLFAPPVLALRNDPRHARLLERTGHEDYWYKSGTQPDFRRR
jgi:DNA-binding winged helix-turn-helix (wHTH) protein